jgi:hypothetical protein
MGIRMRENRGTPPPPPYHRRAGPAAGSGGGPGSGLLGSGKSSRPAFPKPKADGKLSNNFAF